MFRIEVCFLILILVSVVVCENATSTASSAAGSSTTPATTATAATTPPPTTTTTVKPDLLQDAFGKILKVPEDIVGAIADFAGSVFGIFKPK